MRVISWLVVFASITALAWQGLSSLVNPNGLPPVEPFAAVGSVLASPDRGSVAVIRVAQHDDDEFDFTFQGSASRTTAEFEIEGPWILDWRVTNDGGYELAVDVSLEEAGTGVHQGNVLKTKRTGNGVRLFEEGGRFYFRVNSSFAHWTLKVKALTPEEAARYTPRDQQS